MRRFLPIAVLFAGAAVAAVASAADSAPDFRWHGIWMDGQNVLWIVAGPTPEVSVAGAAYHRLGIESYLDSLIHFRATPVGDKLELSSMDSSGCSIELSLSGDSLAAQELSTCSTLGVKFDGTYARQ
jgi:hypothetical protein